MKDAQIHITNTVGGAESFSRDEVKAQIANYQLPKIREKKSHLFEIGPTSAKGKAKGKGKARAKEHGKPGDGELVQPNVI